MIQLCYGESAYGCHYYKYVVVMIHNSWDVSTCCYGEADNGCHGYNCGRTGNSCYVITMGELVLCGGRKGCQGNTYPVHRSSI